MRLEVALLSIPFAFCLSLFALRASIATRSSKGVSLSLRTIAYPFFICKSSLSFFLTILYQKSRDFSNVRLSRRFKTCKNEKSSIFQQKISTLKKALKIRKAARVRLSFSRLFLLPVSGALLSFLLHITGADSLPHLLCMYCLRFCALSPCLPPPQ